MKSPQPPKPYRDQTGIVSILVVSILTITLSLIAIGFSKLADRELRQASDRELSSQAYYAAQSGLNDAKAYLADPNSVTFTGCSTSAAKNPSNYFTPDLAGGTGSAKYSCISVNKTPTELFRTVSPGQPVLLRVSTTTDLTNLFIAWQNSKYPCGIQWLPDISGLPLHSLPPEDSLENCAISKDATGVLRVGLYEVPKSGCNDNNCLSNHSSVYYLYPNDDMANPGVNTVAYSANKYTVANGPLSPNGSIVDGNCTSTNLPNPVQTSDSSPQYCNSEITSLDGLHNIYYLYLTAEYATVNVSVQGNYVGGPVQFIDSQATIDVTGQAGGVIQRIQAKVDIGSNFDLPNYALQSMETICKNFTVDVTNGDPITGPTTYGNARLRENPDTAKTCVAPAGGGNINNPAGDQYTHGH